MKRIAVMPLLFFLLLFHGAAAKAVPLSDLSGGQTGVIEFNSISPANIYVLVTKGSAPTTTIFGTLTFPGALSGKYPAMILAHHCGGVTASVTNLAAMLNSIGVATFVPDSFTPRGYPSGVCTGSTTLPGMTAVPDVLFALKLLATHPNIDPNRIGIIGQSYGGTAVYATAHEEVRQSVITGPLKFAAHIGLYPSGCNSRIWSPNMTAAPMLILLGGADDWTPPGECLTLSVLLRSLGTQTTTVVYPGAPHSWDSTGAVNYNANRGVIGNCRYLYRLDTLQASRYDTGEILTGTTTTSYFNSCTTYGANSGRHAATIALATNDITIFLAKTFNLAAATSASQPDRIFNCAENIYPTLFAPAGTASETGYGYYYRHFGQTNSYLGISGGQLYYYVPNQNPNIIQLGPEGSFLTQASQAGC